MDLSLLLAQGALSPLDQHFAQTLGRLSGERQPQVLLVAAMTHQALQQGHLALDLRLPLTLTWTHQGRLQALDLPHPERLLHLLAQSPLVGPGLPLRLEQGLLYLSRYWDYQQRLVVQLRQRVMPRPLGSPLQQVQALQKHFGPNYGHNRQALAALNAMNQGFSLITGGPGTGKTTTAAKLLAMAMELAPQPLTCWVLAPTGKAAHRLGQSLRGKLESLQLAPELQARFPQEALTLHRALEPLPGPGQTFRRGPDNLIPADLVLVDEASMIDLPLWVTLLEALPPSCRILLMGDPDQLSSVEAGAVLGDLVQAAAPGYSQQQTHQYQSLGFTLPAAWGPLNPHFGDAVTPLTQSHRFGAASEIGQLAQAVVAGKVEQALDLLSQGQQIRWVQPGKELPHELLQLCSQGFAPYLQARGVEPCLQALGNFCLLTATKQGRLGADWANEQIAAWLRHQGLLTGGRMPLLITCNDHQQGLFNGDLGCLLPDAQSPQSDLVAWFAGVDAPRRFSPGLLPQHSPAWAMTTHKSQGSEWNQVALLLPSEDSPLLTRELLYTALTRAKEGFTLFGGKEVIRQALGRQGQRCSGLRQALTGE